MKRNPLGGIYAKLNEHVRRDLLNDAIKRSDVVEALRIEASGPCHPISAKVLNNSEDRARELERLVGILEEKAKARAQGVKLPSERALPDGPPCNPSATSGAGCAGVTAPAPDVGLDRAFAHAKPLRTGATAAEAIPNKLPGPPTSSPKTPTRIAKERAAEFEYLLMLMEAKMKRHQEQVEASEPQAKAPWPKLPQMSDDKIADRFQNRERDPEEVFKDLPEDQREEKAREYYEVCGQTMPASTSSSSMTRGESVNDFQI